MLGLSWGHIRVIESDLEVIEGKWKRRWKRLFKVQGLGSRVLGLGSGV